MLRVRDIVARVAAKADDPDQTYVTPEYVMNFVPDTMDWLFGKLRLTDNQFDEVIVVLPSVDAGTPNLDAFQIEGQPLENMVRPRFVRWRLPGQSDLYWQKAEGPLDFPRDLQPGGAYLDSWAFIRYSIKLANFSTALDVEVTGDFLFDALTGPDSQVVISLAANRVLTCKLASEVGKARGNDKWVATYGADADDALDDLMIAMNKENLAKTSRLGRINRRNGYGGANNLTRS